MGGVASKQTVVFESTSQIDLSEMSVSTAEVATQYLYLVPGFCLIIHTVSRVPSTRLSANISFVNLSTSHVVLQLFAMTVS